MAKLYIFVTTERPDTYLNPIAHCSKHKDVDEVVFVHINDNMPKNPQEVTKVATKRRNDVRDFLSYLVKDEEYRYYVKDPNHEEREKQPLKDIYSKDALSHIKELYKEVEEKVTKWPEGIEIDYKKVRDFLSKIHKSEKNSIFDLTGLNKKYLGDIYAISTAEAIDGIYTFSLIHIDFDHPWTMLYHELYLKDQGRSKYEYVNIVDTEIFKQCSESIRKQKFLLRFASFTTFAFITIYIILSFFLENNRSFNQTLALLSGLAGLASFILSIYPIPKLK